MSGILATEVVVVTGAGQGLGRSYAEHIASHGGKVVVNDIDPRNAEAVVAEIVERGGTAIGNVGSVSDPEAVDALFSQATSQLGPVTGLVNNAGVFHEAMPWEDEPALMRRIVEVNLLGAMLCTAAAARTMHRTQGGAIVNVVSGAALGLRNSSAYAATKGGIASLTFASALDFGSCGVRVNAISPLARTPMTTREGNTSAGGVAESMTPERVAPIVTYLLSDLADGITGQLIRFDGEKLHLIRHPRVSANIVTRPSWTTQEIDAAFRDVLGTELESIGLELLAPPRAMRS